MQILSQGHDFAELRQTLVIFICPFDPFGRGWHLYWFENTCHRDAEQRLTDGAVKIVLNTRGPGEDISPPLQAFMDYVNSGILTTNPLVQALDQRLQDVKHSEAERVSYMTYELHLRDARKEGKLEAVLENIRSLMKSLPCDASKAMDLLNVPATERKAIMAQL